MFKPIGRSFTKLTGCLSIAMLFVLKNATGQAVTVSGTASISGFNASVLEQMTGFAGSSGSASNIANWQLQGGGTNGNTLQGTNLSGGTSGGWYGNGNIAFLGSGTVNNGNATLRMQNITGSTITAFRVVYKGQLWRSQANSPTVSVSWSTSSSNAIPGVGALTNSLSSLGFSDATSSISSGVTFSQSVTSASIVNNNYVFLRFIHTGGSSSDNLSWDDVNFIPRPITQASAITFPSVGSASMTVSWTNGNGRRRAAFMRATSAGTITNPSDGTLYTASTTLGSGEQLGTSGYYCIYDGTGSSVTVSGLSTGTTYYVQVFEYNSDASVTEVTATYLTTAVTGNQATCTPPTVYAVTGGGNYCSGGSGVAIGVANSQTGVNYQLYNGASTIGSPVAGTTGSPVSFGSQTTAATYTVLATSGSCTAAMTGSATVAIDPLPTVNVTPSSAASCFPMTASGADAYSWSPATALTATTGATVTASPTVATTYTVTGTSSLTCTSAATVTVTPASIAMSNTSPATGNVAQGTNNHLLQTFNLAVTAADASLTGLTVVTTGSYTGSDVNALKCWYSNSPTFSTGTATLVSTYSSPGSAGSKTFPSFTAQTISAGTTSYLHITVDIDGIATGGNTIALASTSFSGFSICSATLTGTDPVASSNTQTITAALCSGTPTAGTASPSPAVICGSGTSTLSLTGGASGTGLTYQWSSNTVNSAPGTPISGATNDTYTTGTVSSTTYYWCTTTCSASTLSNISGVGAVSVNPVPASSGATNDGPICSGGSVTLSANSTNASGWDWSGPDGFSSTLQNPTATPTVTGTYSLTVSSTGSGCAPATVYTTSVTVNPAPISSGPTSDGPICVGGTVNLSANSSNATSWSWSGPSGFSSTLQNPSATPTTTGTYSLSVASSGAPGCSPSTVYTTSVTVNAVPSSSGPTNSGPICAGSSVTLSANSTGATAWSWSGPSGFTSTLQNPTNSPTATATYSLTVSRSGSGCNPSTVYTTSVTVNSVPTVTVTPPSGNSGVSLTASGGTTYTWSPSSGLSATTGATVTASPTVTTTYTVSGTTSGCTGTATALVNFAGGTVTWDFTPGTSGQATTSTNANLAASSCIASIGNSLGTVSAPINSTSASSNSGASGGNNIGNACKLGSFDDATSSYINLLLTPNSGYCLTLSDVDFGTRSTGTGAQGFTVTSDVAGFATSLASGSIANNSAWSAKTTSITPYTAGPSEPVNVRIYGHSGSGSPSSGTINWRLDDIAVTYSVNPAPSLASVSTGGAVCSGSALSLFANTPANVASYSWTGPNSFTSTLQNPSVSGASTAASGTYTVVVNNGYGCTRTYTTTATVNPIPTSSGATNSGPICVGGTVSMFANSTNANQWSWSGPSGFASTLQNPTATLTATGTYSLSISNATTGCSQSTVYTTSVTVNSVPTSTGATNDGPICVGGTVNLSANSTGATSWSWSGPSGFASTLQNPTATPTTTGTYSLTVSSTGSGCNPSTVYTTSVTVNSVPTSTGATNDGPICVGGTVNLSANSTGATSWSWSGPSGYASTLQNPTATPTTTGTYSLTVSSTGSGCNPSTVYTTSVTVNSVPTSTGTINDGPICVGGTVNLFANSTGATSWSWSGPSGFASTLQNPTATPTTTGTYSLTVSSTGSGCNPSTVYTTSVAVNSVPTSSGATNDGPICVGGTVNLSANSTGATSWSWSGPSGYASTLQNPTATPTTTGTYSLTVSSTGSGCNPATVYTTSVTVNSVPTSTGATNDGPICVGGTVNMSANSTGATSWSWSGPSGYASTLQNPTATPTTTGTYSLTVSSTGSGCNPATVYTTSVTVNSVPTSSGATNDGPICVGGTVNLSANSTGATSWSWSGPSGFASTLQNPTATPTTTGTYSLTVSSTGSGCNPSTVYTTSVTVNSVPTSTGATNDGPICVGGTVNMSANSTGATSWSWSGPAGFASTLQNPTATPTTTGTYSLTVSSTGSGCNPSTVYTTSVTVNSIPTSTGATNDGPICVGGTVNLSANSTGATSWSWSGPSGFASTLQNPTATPTTTGTYSLTVSNTGSGCNPSTVYTTSVTVNSVPTSTGATNDGPICVGGTVNLSANSTGATSWSWSGPSGYASTLQNPTATPTTTGTYSLTVSSTGSGCNPATVYTTSVTVNSVPTSTGATNDGPVCVGGTVNLSANSTGATSWSWSGPSGFASTLQNPTATPTTTSTYSLTVSSTGSGCNPSTVYTTSVTVNSVPTSTGATNDGPICVGGTVNLSANSTGATSWSWSGPSGFASPMQNPTATPTTTGTYSLTVSSTGSGCNPSTVYTTSVTVNSVPTSTGATNDGPICVGGTVNLSANSTGATSWSWSGPSGFASTLQNPTATPTTTGTYSLTVSSTGSGCNPSTVYTTSVTVNSIPTSTGATNDGPICVGGTVNLSANSTGATSWSWSGPSGFASTLQNPTATPTTTGTYSLTVSSTGSGCNPATVYTTSVTVNSVPTSTGATNDGPICVGGTVNLSANSTGATSWSWSGPAGFASTLQNPTATPTTTGTYSLTVSSTGSGCNPSTVYTTSVTVNSVPTSAGATNDGPICVGGTVNLSANSTGANSWSWSGPAGFASTLQNPTATPTTTGTYSLTVSSTGSGCNPSTVYTTSVTVNSVPTSTGATNDGPICVGGTVNLSANSTGTTSWSWSGPSGFASTLQNPTATPTTTSTYSLTVSSTGSGCNPSTVYTTSVTVNSVPTSTGANNDGPICVGGTVNLSANSTGATSWSWSGPSGFASTLQNPTATPTTTGTYSLAVSSTGSGCNPSTVYTTSVTVNSVPTSTGATNDGPICVGGTVNLSANSTGATSWSWSGPSGFASTLQNPTATPTTTGTYSLTVSSTGSGCNPATVYTTSVTVNSVPTSTGATNDGPICVGGTVNLSANSTGATSWSWSGPSGYASTLQNPTATPTTNGTYSLTVSSTGSGCNPSTVYTTSVTVNPVPTSSGATNDGPICVGGTVNLSANSTGATSWSWSGPAGFASTLQNSTATPTTTGTYSLTVGSTGSGCNPATVYTTSVTVNSVPTSTGATNDGPICIGGTVNLSANSTGATSWSWSGPAGFASTLQNPTATPTTTGTYSLTVASTGSGCNPSTVYTTSVTVNSVPTSSGATNDGPICVGGTVNLSANSTGATSWSWSGPLGYASTLQNPTATPTTTGTYSLTVSSTGSGCNPVTVYTTSVTVNPVPTSTGATNDGPICIGGTVNLSANSTGATSWSWSGPSGYASTLQNPTATPTTTGTYSLTVSSTGSGCIPSTVYTTSVTVNPVPTSTGATNDGPICIGGTVNLSANSTGATSWSWSGPSGYASTLQNPTATPTTTGTYSLTMSSVGSGCNPSTVYTTSVTVNPLPSAISGAANVCVGSTTALTNAGGGAWSSSNTSFATVGSSTGVVTGIGAGNVIITYTLPTSCLITKALTVDPVPSAISITGAISACEGGSATLIPSTTGGAWAGGTTATATINSSGVVSAIGAGVATFTYSVTNGFGCTTDAFHSFTVNPLPATSTGDSIVCSGGTITLSNSSGGGTWSSSNTGNAAVGSLSGIVTGVSTGVVNITYTINATGCYSTKSVTVNPSLPSITGNPYVCLGTTTTLANATSGGTWSSGNTARATVGSSSGIVTGISTGAVTISYIVSQGCLTTTTVNVQNISMAISGSLSVCAGSTSVLSSSSTGGTWMSGNTTVAGINATTGLMTGISAGTADITYTVGSCYTAQVATVNPMPDTIGGIVNICAGSSISLTHSTGGGVWSSSSTSIATIGTTSGILTGVSAGTATITYTLATSCYRTAVVAIGATPATITGNLSLCPAGTTTLTCATGGGTWSSSNTAVATIGSSTGSVSAVSTGNATVTYHHPGGCIQTATLTVNAMPDTSLGMNAVCTGGSINLTNASSGGTWSSSNTALLTVGSTTGVVSGVAVGSGFITYRLPGAGCYTEKAVSVYNVLPAITGTTYLCIGTTSTLANTIGGGTWSSSNASRAAVDASTGVVTALGQGTYTITYTVSTGCFTTISVTIPNIALNIFGSLTVCAGATSALTCSSTGGTWSSSNTSVAGINATTGLMTGFTAGTATISYIAAGCHTTRTATVNPVPAAITGTAAVCAGSTTTLSSSTTGGTWSSGNVARATVGSSTGVVTAVAAGTVNITYTIATGCRQIKLVTVGAMPASITGNTNTCAGSTTVLYCATTGGTWSSSNTSVATASGTTTSAVVAGISAGMAEISYSHSGGCVRTTTVTVSAPAPANTGDSVMCVGGTVTLANTTSGGTWSSSNTARATVGSATGVVAGVAVGTARITYVLPTGCYAITQVSVNSGAAAISGAARVCVGFTTSLAHSMSGGVWSSSNTSRATVDAATGVVTGVSTGPLNITYSLAAGCFAVKSFYVDNLPLAISGSHTVCEGSMASLTCMPGSTGTWSCSDTTKAQVTNYGLLTGVATGVVTVSYANAMGCYVTHEVTVNLKPASIGGVSDYCVESATTFSCTTTGGVWTTTNYGVTSIDSSSGYAVGLSGGVMSIRYVMPTGCFSNKVVTVNAIPGAITGNYVLCVGNSLVLSSSTYGSTWSSSDSTITGLTTMATNTLTVNALSTGSATISYTNASGCARSVILTVNAAVTASAGVSNVCVGNVTTFANSTTGGTWSSSSYSIAAVNGTTGVVTGIAPAAANITYNLSAGCRTVSPITVNAATASLSGYNIVCPGDSVTFTSPVAGGTWASANHSIATVGATGLVTGVAGGTTAITYFVSAGCYSTRNVIVKTMPAIAGASSVVIGSSTALSGTPSGGTWSSGTPAIAPVSSSGVVSGLTLGSSVISYTYVGCAATWPVTVTSTVARVTSEPSGSVVRVYPNPTMGAFNIATTLAGTVSLADVRGAIVVRVSVEAGISHIELPGDLAAGIYVGRFISATGEICGFSLTLNR